MQLKLNSTSTHWAIYQFIIIKRRTTDLSALICSRYGMCTSFFANSFVSKKLFCWISIVLRLNFTLSSIVFVNFLLVLREKSFFANHEVKKYSRIGSDEYSFECALKLSSPFTHGQIVNGQLTNQSVSFTSVMFLCILSWNYFISQRFVHLSIY